MVRLKTLWKDKETRETFYSSILIISMLCIFWIFLFYGVVAEQDRREGQKSNRRWVQERALNQWETEQRMATVPMQQPELMKAMRQVSR
jgi:phytoene/squalene synthetase